MVNERYKIAISETLHYLKGIKQSDIDKIPNKFMDFLRNNESPNYKCNFDYTKPLSELELMDETKGLIAMICLNYWCETETQKNNFKKHISENETKYQEELRKKYNPNDIFKYKTEKDNINNTTNSNLPIEVKENIITKIINYIKSMFYKYK